MPKGRADVIVGLEPMEALRVIAQYGNPEVLLIVNNRPVHPIGVICGDNEYPSQDEIEASLKAFSRRHWLLPATDAATGLGSAILANIVLIGALAATGVLPLDRDVFSDVIASKMQAEKAEVNLRAFDLGRQMIG
jgi:indolepyruvate ferredoxin oxidoreductase beta subunit